MSAVISRSISDGHFSRRIVVPMAAMIILSILTVAAFVIVSAVGQNRLAVQSSTALATTALEVKKRELARNLRDYAVWDDAYNNLARSFDFEWASTDGNVGANLYNGLGYDLALVISPDKSIIYSVVSGLPLRGVSTGSLPDGLMKLVDSATSRDEPAVGLLRRGGDLMVLAATPILPASSTMEPAPGNLSKLVFGKYLNETFLNKISGDYLLRDIGLSVEAPPTSSASIPLTGPDGEVLAQLFWSPELPGYELLKLLLPPLSIGMLVLAAFAWFVVRNIKTSTRALEESAQTVEAFAQTLQESEARFRDVAEASSDWIWECDKDLRLIYLSRRFSEVTGIAAASVLGKSIQRFFFSDAGSDGWTKLHEGTDEHTSFRDLRCSYNDANENTRICRLAGRPSFAADGTFVGYRGTATDITEEVEAQARAHHLALHDSLTELPNRVLFRARLEEALANNAKDRSRIAVLCLDLDHFKEVNDTLGHGAGDLLLKELSERLKSCVRSGDTVARLGGDEFAIIQVGVNQPVEAGALSRKLMEMIKKPFSVDGQELYIGVSIGVALPETVADDPERLLKNADIALYRAKQAGRATTRFFEPQMDIDLQARKQLEYDLRQALLKNELEVHYQPLIDLEGRSIAAVEALLRWHHPTRGLVAPNDFIPMAEETGLIIPIGEWVLRTACEQALEWPSVKVAVNLSPVQFRHRELVDTVSQVLKDTGLEASRLELEVTESILINDTESAMKILTALKRLGVNIAMDDFGTGYSSLGYLNAFPFDKIKIDRSFISSMDGDVEKSMAIVKSVISLGQSLSMTTTAEGVETLAQANFLLDEGCKQVQGYFFGRPVPAIEFSAFLKSWKGFDRGAASTEAA